MKKRKTDYNSTVKTFSLKVKSVCGVSVDTLSEAITEYKNYYNYCSHWLNEHLMTKIGELYQYIPEDKRDNDYARLLISDEWRNEPIYKMFKKGYSTNHRDCALYEVIAACNPEHYSGNILNIGDTYYRRFGYVQLVTSNYAAKISKMSTGSRKRRIDITSTDEALMEQVFSSVRPHEAVEEVTKPAPVNPVSSLISK